MSGTGRRERPWITPRHEGLSAPFGWRVWWWCYCVWEWR